MKLHILRSPTLENVGIDKGPGYMWDWLSFSFFPEQVRYENRPTVKHAISTVIAYSDVRCALSLLLAEFLVCSCDSDLDPITFT